MLKMETKKNWKKKRNDSVFGQPTSLGQMEEKDKQTAQK
jgi:hypothetical protein